MSQIKVHEAINQALDEEMSRNKRIFIIGEEVGHSNGTYKATANLLKKHGSLRVIDTPICEMGFTGAAVGASFTGLVPVCEFMTWNFALQAIDHIINSSAKMLYMSGGLISSSIVFRGPNGYSPGVGAQHTQDFASVYGNVPGLKVIMPYSAKDHRGTLKKALRDNNPIVILENEVLYEQEFVRDSSFDEDYVQEFKCVVEREGSAVTVVGMSINLNSCLEACDILDKENIKIEVIKFLSVRPQDIETILESVRKTKRLLVVDNEWPFCSVASEISSQVHEALFETPSKPVKRLNGKDCPTAYSENLEKMSFPSTKEIIEEVKRLLN